MGLNDIVSRLLDAIFEMDFKGQHSAERLYQVIIIAFSVAAFVAGYISQSIRLSVQIWAVGFAISALIALFGWPCFKRHPVRWLSSVDDPLPAYAQTPGTAALASATSETAGSKQSASKDAAGGSSRGGVSKR